MTQNTAIARRLGVPTALREGNWQQAWRDMLAPIAARGINRLHLTDFDGTKYGDILVQANEALGPIDEVSGQKRWRLYDAAFKNPEGALIVPGRTVIPATARATFKGDRMFMTNGAHLEAEFDDLFEAMRAQYPGEEPLPKLAAWAAANVPLIPGAREFVSSLESMNIASVGITNGAWQLAEALLSHHGLDIPFMGNYFEGEKFTSVHDEDKGVDKAALVEMAAEMGFQVVSCAGDSKGDIGLCTATAKLGGLVIVRGRNGGLADWAEKNLKLNQWVLVESYIGKEALTAVQQCIAEPAL
jgi:phosphoserine phosphatase